MTYEADRVHPVIVIGAGFSGLNMAIRLKQAGYTDFIVLERAKDVGGTWRDNVYPGCACDVPSVLYSYSFEQNPSWSTAFAGSSEIHAYMRRVAEKHALYEHIRFGVDITRSVFDADAGLWTLHTADGQSLRARFVVSAVGGLVKPGFPAMEGRERFRGKTMHTARWDASFSLRGKRVGVIGTGASAVQVIPAIAGDVASMTVFQRTPAWVVPKLDGPIDARVQRIFRKLPRVQRAVRNATFLGSEALLAPALILDSPLTKVLEGVARAHMERQITDPALRKKLTPSFRIGCKRLLISSDYYPALARDNVVLETNGIEAITDEGIRTRDGAVHELDVIIFATGFEVEINRAPFEIVGLHGQTLTEAWQRRGGKAYKGMAVAGFPNWMLMLGPNTGPGHTSVLVYTEAQAGYILAAIERLFTGELKYLTVKRAVQEHYGHTLARRMRFTTWSSGCASWYLDANGENHTLFPGLASEYVRSVKAFRSDEYVEVSRLARDFREPTRTKASARNVTPAG
jgi:cation diffusion facilitator CzcD-associated flavoprotein CzcO